MSTEEAKKLAAEDDGGAGAGGQGPKAVVYKAKLVLKAWGKHSDDVYAPRGKSVLEFDAVVDEKGKCKTCGLSDDVEYMQYHPGSCGAYEWVYGVDINWRWLCCGKHENLAHEKYCKPNGYHKSK